MAQQGYKLWCQDVCWWRFSSLQVFLDVFAFPREMKCRTGLYKSLYTGTIDLPPWLTSSGPLGAPCSCNNTLAIQSWQRITSLPGHLRVSSIKPAKSYRTQELPTCNIWGSPRTELWEKRLSHCDCWWLFFVFWAYSNTAFHALTLTRPFV